MPKLGLIAGNGNFPLLATEEAQAKGFEVYAVCVRGEADVRLEKKANQSQWVRLGEIGKTMKFFKSHDVRDLFFAGKITKTSLWKGDIRPDLHALQMMATLKDRKDDTLLGHVCRYFEKHHFKILETSFLMERFFAKREVYTKKSPNSKQNEDIEFGWQLAKHMGSLDIGQTVVVKDKAVMAIEAIEGTDEAIRRGGKIAKNDAVVVKVAKPEQDARFDVPAVGLSTLEAMKEVKASVLAIEAGKTLILDLEEFVKKANSYGLVVVGR